MKNKKYMKPVELTKEDEIVFSDEEDVEDSKNIESEYEREREREREREISERSVSWRLRSRDVPLEYNKKRL